MLVLFATVAVVVAVAAAVVVEVAVAGRNTGSAGRGGRGGGAATARAGADCIRCCCPVLQKLLQLVRATVTVLVFWGCGAVAVAFVATAMAAVISLQL